MGLVDRIERKLEVDRRRCVRPRLRRIDRAARGRGDASQRKPTSGAREVGGGRILAPNDYVITLSVPDYQKVSADPDLTSTTFAKHLEGLHP